MKPFLYLDNWHAPQAVSRFDDFLNSSGLQIETVRTNAGQLPRDSDYCGVFVSPSFNGAYDDLPWVHRLHEILRSLATRSIPMLGLCFGSQILASALVGREQVFIRDSRETGWGEISLTEAARDDPLTRGLPDNIPAFHWHGDEVAAPHPDIIVIARSTGCGNQIWRWARGPVWGVQPHFEYDGDGLRVWFSGNRGQFEAAGMTLSGLESSASNCNDGFRLLENFVGIAANSDCMRIGKGRIPEE